MNKPYHVFSHFYDGIMGDRPEAAALIKQLLAKYLKPKDKILEIACGTGTMMKHLSKIYQVDGLDSSSDMLTIAQSKLPKARLIQANMASFYLDQKYAAIYCIYDSLNHLLTIEDWQKAFASAANNLIDSGLFVFDINTRSHLIKISQESAYAQPFGRDYLFMKVHDTGKNIFDFDIRIFEHIADNKYQLHQETIPETAFPLNVVRSTLNRHFLILECITADGSPASDDTNDRVYYVCRKK